jgi:2-dehydropantoate 2-reductase
MIRKGGISVPGTADTLLIWGAGAIGGTLGAWLARKGHAVAFVDLVPEHVQAIRTTGLAIEGPIDNFTVTAPAFTPGELAGRYDRIVLAVKAHHTRGAAEALKPFLADDGYVLSAQNGLNEIVISDVVGAGRTIGAFVNFGADYLGPGRLTYGGRGAFVLGEIDGRITPRLTALHALISDFEPGAIVTDNIWGYLWGKLAYGAMLFATALTNDSICDCLANETYFPLFRALGREVTMIAHAKGIRPEGFNGFDPGAYAPGADEAAARKSAADMVAFNARSTKTHSGIWRDLAVRKRKTEVDAQIAIIAAEAAKIGRQAPIVRRLVELIHDVEDGRRPLERGNLDLLARAAARNPGE